jgi:hypothetical protein
MVTDQTPSIFDQLSWGNDDGTSCEAKFGIYTIYQVCGSNSFYWRIEEKGGELIEDGDEEEALKTAVNNLPINSRAKIHP